jgi:hypothetical protein
MPLASTRIRMHRATRAAAIGYGLRSLQLLPDTASQYDHCAVILSAERAKFDRVAERCRSYAALGAAVRVVVLRAQHDGRVGQRLPHSA